MSSDDSRQALVNQLSDMTLPMMWVLRQDAMHAFEPLGIRPFKALLLELIARGFQHPKALSEILDTLPPTVSAMLAELEEKALITRQIDPSDRRRVQLALSEKGQLLRGDLREHWHAVGKERLQQLSEDDLATLLRIYTKLLEGHEGT